MRKSGFIFVLLALLALLPALLMAQPVEVAGVKFDVSPLLERTTACSTYTNRRAWLAGACFEAVTFPAAWGGVHAGVTWVADEGSTGAGRGVSGVLLAPALRADTLAGWAWRKARGDERGFKMNFVVPSIQFGPAGGYASNAGGWFWGGFVNVGVPL